MTSDTPSGRKSTWRCPDCGQIIAVGDVQTYFRDRQKHQCPKAGLITQHPGKVERKG